MTAFKNRGLLLLAFAILLYLLVLTAEILLGVKDILTKPFKMDINIPRARKAKYIEIQNYLK